MDIAVDDRQAIVDLQNRYAYAIDAGRYDELDEVFTADAVANYGPAGRAEGVEAIKATCRHALQPLTAAQHINTNHWAIIDGDVARAGCYLHVHQYRESTPGGDHLEMGGRYEDELTRTSDGWRITSRTLVILWSQGNPDVRWKR